jgi:hypothetical protein
MRRGRAKIMNKITLTSDEGENIELYIVEQTTLGGVNYYLATEEESGDSDAWILKDESGKEEEEALFTIVEDETELAAVAGVFSELLEDTDIV